MPSSRKLIVERLTGSGVNVLFEEDVPFASFEVEEGDDGHIHLTLDLTDEVQNTATIEDQLRDAQPDPRTLAAAEGAPAEKPKRKPAAKKSAAKKSTARAPKKKG